MDSIVNDCWLAFRSAWKALALTDVAYKLLSFVVLTPLAGLLLRTGVALSGNEVLSDLDIALFFLRPIGFVFAVVLAAIWLGIVALEQASLLSLLYARAAGRRLGPIGAIRLAVSVGWPILRVTTRMVLLTLLTAAPFLAVAGATYFALLTQYDINYYLLERPPVFLLALAVGAVLVIVLTALLLRLFTGWFFALPLVVFERVPPKLALSESRVRVHGHRMRVLRWIVCWALATLAASALAAALVGLIGQWLVPLATGSLYLLAFAVGTSLVIWAVLGLAVNLLSTTVFATMLFTLYRRLGSEGTSSPAALEQIERASALAGIQITTPRLIAWSTVAVVLAATIGVFAMKTIALEDNVLIMAHRGSSQAAPENTMAAIRKAIEDGADWVEIDVQETADGEVVVMHDSDFMKLAGVDLKIWDATLQDLAEIDIGSRFAPEFRDERVPTLAAVLDECKGRIGVNIELKYYGHDQQLEQRVAEIVESRDMADDVMIMSLKMEGVRKMKALRPDWKVGLLMSVAAGGVRKLPADFLAVNASFANRGLIGAAHRSDKDVYVWTVNDAPTMSIMISRGVNGLLTDNPALARRVLEQRAEMTPLERVLLEIAVFLGAEPQLGDP